MTAPRTVRSSFSSLKTRIALALAVIGPGIITANVDNDAGGITTYSVAGAKYGYELLWIMPLVLLALLMVQEMSARLGVMSGKGLADLIRENMGVRITAILVLILLVANVANTVSEFAGVAASMELFGVSKYFSVPASAIIVWFLIAKGNYRFVERVFLAASTIYLAYVASGFLAHPDWSLAAKETVTPHFYLNSDYLVLIITIIGTTIAPWMQFYQQSSIADKGLKPEDYRLEYLDVFIGSLFAIVVAVFITISCAATLHRHQIPIETAEQAALALRPLAGSYASMLFALGLLNASLFSAAVLPLSTAYVVCEAFGWESGVNHSFKQAPVFFSIYGAMILLGAGIILLPIKSLIFAMFASQTLNGILLPVILVTMLRLVNDSSIVGKYTNGRISNILAWSMVVVLIVLTAALIFMSLYQAGAE